MLRDKPYQITNINGIQTILFPLEDKKAVKAELWIRAGSWYEGKDYGAFHLLEHMCHQGTQKFPTPRKLEVFKETYGLKANAFTAPDVVGFWCLGPYYNAKKIIEYLNQAIFKPLIPSEKISKEIDVVRQEYHDTWDDPYRRFHFALLKQLYGSTHPYTKDALGKPEYFGTLARTDLAHLYDHYFTADNMILAVAGKFKPEEMIDLLSKSLNPKQSAKRKKLVIPKTITDHKPLIHREQVKQDRVIISWLLPGMNKLPLKERAILRRASYILGGSTRSILFNEIREKRGLAYGVGSGLNISQHFSRFEIGTSTNPQNKQKVIDLFEKILTKYLKTPISENVFRRAQGYLNAQIMMSFDSLSEISSYVLGDLYYEGRIYLPDEYLDIVKTITKKEVETSLAKYIDPHKGVLSIMTGLDSD